MGRQMSQRHSVIIKQGCNEGSSYLWVAHVILALCHLKVPHAFGTLFENSVATCCTFASWSFQSYHSSELSMAVSDLLTSGHQCCVALAQRYCLHCICHSQRTFTWTMFSGFVQPSSFAPYSPFYLILHSLITNMGLLIKSELQALSGVKSPTSHFSHMNEPSFLENRASNLFIIQRSLLAWF